MNAVYGCWANTQLTICEMGHEPRAGPAGHEGRAAADAQTRQFYRLLDLLRERFPRVEFESCASGGGRIDFEVLTRTHRFWASDNNDARSAAPYSVA